MREPTNRDDAHLVQPDESVSSVARDWVIRLASGRVTAEEMSRFKFWFDASPGHRVAFDRERTFWQQLDQLQGASAKWDGGIPPLAARPRAPAWSVRRTALIGGTVAASLALALLYHDIRLFLTADYRTAVGQQQVLTLPDGSIAHLNTDSALAVAYTAGERRIELLRGEALFTVRPDPQKPFRVLAQGGVAQAVGTAFVVQAQDEQTRVTVAEGIVEVFAGDGGSRLTGPSILVRKDEQTAYRFGEVPQAVVSRDSHAVTAWTRGAIVIDGQPFEQAMAELDRYRPGRIVVLADISRTKPVSGRFTQAGIDDALTALAATQGLSVIRVAKYLVVII
jgi:transmembrane sensor